MKITRAGGGCLFVTALPIGAVGSNAQVLATLLTHIRPKTTIVSDPVGHRKNIEFKPGQSGNPKGVRRKTSDEDPRRSWSAATGISIQARPER